MINIILFDVGPINIPKDDSIHFKVFKLSENKKTESYKRELKIKLTLLFYDFIYMGIFEV